MKRNTLTGLFLLAIVIFMGACGEGNTYDELPKPIAEFVSQYFPFGEVDGYTVDKNGNSIVQIRNGSTLTFDAECDWTDVNGNGSVLPGNFLYNQLPPVLYNYIESIEFVNKVYRVSRTSTGVKVEFQDTYVVYDDESQKITYPEGEPKNASTILAEENQSE